MKMIPNILVQEVYEQMRERLEWMLVKPNVSVNYSCSQPVDTQVLANNCVELLMANLALPCNANLEAVLQEWQRILRPGGLLMFSSLGPDTLKAWHDVCTASTLHLSDMHVVGDALLQAGLADPVLDVDYITLTYKDAETFFKELKIDTQADIESYRNQAGLFEAVFEVVYGHAWAVEAPLPEQRFPISELRRSLSLVR